eukprot:3004396-Prymnesium_polylepis.1
MGAVVRWGNLCGGLYRCIDEGGNVWKGQGSIPVTQKHALMKSCPKTMVRSSRLVTSERYSSTS